MLDDIANAAAPLISPEMYREQVFPHFKQLISNFHKTGLKAIKHSDGNLYPILDCLIESGIDCLDPIDPMGGMDLAGILREYGDKISCKGNIDCVHVLVDGTFEEVENAVKECIAAGAVNGGHIISSSNSIHKGISPANYKFMLECIRKYGKHPVNM